MSTGMRILRTAVAAAIVACLGAAPPVRAEAIVASGCSVSTVGYLNDLARDYERLTGASLLVRGGGSVLGLEELKSGKTDFAASCRARGAGDPADLEFIPAAWDALVFIVHPANPLTGITLEEVRGIYQGRIRDWGGLKAPPGPIKLFIARSQQGLSGVEGSTRHLVLAGTDPVPTPETVTLASTGIVEQLVEKTPAGFATTGFSSARKRRVTMLAVDGVPPTKANIGSGKYPFARPLYLVVPRGAKPGVRAFVDFALGRQGQELISSYGIVSLAEMRNPTAPGAP
jgi:phosphate transport system substrate-binding protein